MSALDQFTATVNQVTVEDATSPSLEPAENHTSELPIAISEQSNGEPDSSDPTDWTISHIRRAYQAHELSATSLVEGLLARIDNREAQVLGWVALNPSALDQAVVCDSEISKSPSDKPLLGIPLGIKDLVDVAGLPTTCGSRHNSSDPVTTESSAITRLREAGAIIMGKTTTHEYAFGGTTPPTRNPWNLDTVPGGSSGGSGAVLGAGMVPGAIGTDTAGSVRIPASYCGVVGFMGSYGRVPTDNVAVLAWSLDHVGAMARTVTDTAVMHSVIAGLPTPTLPIARALPQTVGVPHSVLEPMHPSVREAFNTALDALRARGVQVVDVPWPDPALLEAVGFILMMAESAAYHAQRMHNPDLFDPQVAELLVSGATVSAVDHLQALRVRTQIAAWFDDLLTETPLVLTPTLPCLPPPLGSDTFTPVDLGSETQPLAAAHTRFPLAANIAGSPAGSLPCGLRDGFPIGLHVMGRRGSDMGVLTVMAGIEEVLAQDSLWQPGTIAPLSGGN